MAAAVVLTMAGWGGTMLHATISPQNQCPGDCSPCLGPEDPFCSYTYSAATSSSSHFCVYCESPTGNCYDAKPGQYGKDDSCTVVTEGTRVVSCTAKGNQCIGSSVTP